MHRDIFIVWSRPKGPEPEVVPGIPPEPKPFNLDDGGWRIINAVYTPMEATQIASLWQNLKEETHIQSIRLMERRNLCPNLGS